MRLIGRASAIAFALTLLGCASGGTLTPPTVHETEIAFGVPMGAPLRTLPFNQTYAWVQPSQLWLGTLPRDDAMDDRGFVQRLKAKSEISFRALDWTEVDASVARYHVAILNAERTVRTSGYGRTNAPSSARGNGGTESVLAPAGRQISQVYRGIAIRRLSDGAVFWHLLWTGDQWNNAEILGNLVAELAVGRAPVPQ